MKSKTILSIFLVVGTMVFAFFAIADQIEKNRPSRSDIVVIDAMKVFGDLERPAVPFPHDLHTKTLAREGKDCDTCHESSDDQLVLTFKRVNDTDKDTVLDIYHTDCITCHEETEARGDASGPLECGSCHQRDPEYTATQVLIDFDPSLHHRHITSADNDCETCHHGYDKDRKQIVYTKGEEESCRACHGENLLDEALPYRDAAHQQCIDCHRDEANDEGIKIEEVAAVQCAGCHDATVLAGIEKLKDIPRLDRNQPDTTFVKSLQELTGQLMAAVVFDHRSHETHVGQCSTCHHQTLQSCESCHSLAGREEGDWITLSQAMHDVNSDRSCVGCHAEELKRSECAGCHSLIKPRRHVSENRPCETCHAVPVTQLKTDRAAGRKLSADRYHSQPIRTGTIDIDALPEEMIIDVIADEYKGARFPHRAIVMALMDDIAGNELAETFHREDNLVCRSCHHNSPETMNPPPRCISCHAESKTAPGSRIPEMKAAYHQQCFDCHEAMEITRLKSTDCVVCHEERKSN